MAVITARGEFSFFLQESSLSDRICRLLERKDPMVKFLLRAIEKVVIWISKERSRAGKDVVADVSYQSKNDQVRQVPRERKKKQGWLSLVTAKTTLVVQ